MLRVDFVGTLCRIGPSTRALPLLCTDQRRSTIPEKDELLREVAGLHNDKELACQGNRHGDNQSQEENDDD